MDVTVITRMRIANVHHLTLVIFASAAEIETTRKLASHTPPTDAIIAIGQSTIPVPERYQGYPSKMMIPRRHSSPTQRVGAEITSEIDSIKIIFLSSHTNRVAHIDIYKLNPIHPTNETSETHAWRNIQTGI
jgi:hypothetical protein